MSSFVIVVGAARSRDVQMIKGVIGDWTVAGLTRRLLWIDEEEIEQAIDVGQVRCQHLGPEGVTDVVLSDFMTEVGVVDRLRVVAISAIGSTRAAFGSSSAARLLDVLGHLFPMRSITKIHCLEFEVGGQPWSRDLVLPEWRNVVIAPEDGYRPSGMPEAMTTAGSGNDEAVPHAAMVVACVSGMWTGVDECALDAPSTAVETTVLVARGFARWLDGAAVRRSLMVELADFSDHYPAAYLGNRAQSEYFPDSAAAADDVVGKLWGKHQALFFKHREQPRRVTPRKIGLIGAIKMFFGFMVAAIKRAPADWLHRVVDDVVSKVARRANAAIFGPENSQFEVVVLGRSASGGMARPEEIDAAAAELAKRADSVQDAEPFSWPDTSAFWTDFVAGGLSLVDAGSRLSGIELPLVNGRPAVIARAGEVVAGPDEVFDALPGAVAATLTQTYGVAAVPAHDPLLADQVLVELQAFRAKYPALATETNRAEFDLQTWSAGLNRTYAGRLGGAFVTLVGELRAEIRGLLADMQAAASQEIGHELEKTQRHLARWIRRSLVILGIVVVAVAALVLGPISLLLGGVLLIASTSTWAVAAGWTFWVRQRKLFQLLNMRAVAEEADRVRIANLVLAVNQLRLTSQLCAQFTLWSRTLGHFVREPFGRSAALDGVLFRVYGSGTRSVQVGTALPPPGGVGQARFPIAEELFVPGWLSGPWEVFLEDARRQLATRGVNSRAADILFADPGRPGGVAATWAEDVVRGSSAQTLATSYGGRIDDILRKRQWLELSRDLIGSVAVPPRSGVGEPTSSAAETFLGDLVEDTQPGRAGEFSRLVFSGEGRNQESFLVARTVLVASTEVAGQGVAPETERSVPDISDRGALDQFVMLTQYSAELRLDWIGPTPAGVVQP